MNKAVIRNMKQITIGLDLGDRRHTYCVLDEAGRNSQGQEAGRRRRRTKARRIAPHALEIP